MIVGTGPLADLLAGTAGWDPGDLPPIPAPAAEGATTLTQAGLPYELSASSGPGGPSRRYVLDLAAGLPDPVERLAAQAAGIELWAHRCGIDGRPAADLLGAAYRGQTLRPAPFLAWLGAVHPRTGAPPTALKVYVCAEAATGVLGRAAERWSEVAVMADLLPAAPAPVLSVAVTLRAGLPPTWTLYRPVREGYQHQAVESLARAVGADPARWSRDLVRTGLARSLWSDAVVLSTTVRTGQEITVGLDLSLDRWGHRALAAARSVAERDVAASAALDELLAWTATAGRPVQPTWVGLDWRYPEGCGVAVYGVPLVG